MRHSTRHVFALVIASSLTDLVVSFSSLSASRRIVHPSTRRSPFTAPFTTRAAPASTADEEPLPSTLVPIWLGVFAQMLGEGVAISSLPLHMLAMGASPTQTGIATSCFSVAQMVCCPLLVGASGRLGRATILRTCLAGAALSNVAIACATTPAGVVAGRCLAGVFAASVPVAQAASADVVKPEQTTRALSRVSASSQLGVVVGPAAVALLAALYGRLGVPQQYQTRAVFATSSVFALCVLALSGIVSRQNSSSGSSGGSSVHVKESSQPSAETATALAGTAENKKSAASPSPQKNTSVQACLRLVALACGWSLTLSVGTYCLFGGAVLGYDQARLSATFSAGAAVTIATQLWLLPRLVRRFGEFASCSLGLASVGVGLAGLSCVVRQPFHTCLYLLNRVGSGVGDTSTAALVAKFSPSPEARATNLGLVQSTRAAARIATPLLSGWLFERSCQAGWRFTPTGALPYLCLSALALSLTPIPLALRRIDNKRLQREEIARKEEEQQRVTRQVAAA